MAVDFRSTPDTDRRSARRRRWLLRGLLLALGVVVTVAVASWVEHAAPPDTLSRLLAWLARQQQANSGAIATFVGFAVFVAAACVGCPINVCIAASVLVLAPWRGAWVAFAATSASALLLHRAGAWMPEDRLPGWLRDRDALLRRLRGNIAAIALLRLVPVAPYCIVSLLAGVVRVPRGPYLLGTGLGMAPGILLYALLLDRAQVVLRNPHALAAFAAMGSVLLMAGAYLACTRWARRHTAP